ncbi:MAG: hypothetical protein L0G70_11805, partial [Rubrobacter sp.]|nr:hypothetical protein [Rubrobacter sp.]
LTLTPRSLDNGGVEVKERKSGESEVVSVEEAVKETGARLSKLLREIDDSGVEVAFGEQPAR